MRKAGKLLAILLLLIAVTVIILGLIAPREFSIQRSITINAPQPAVAEQMLRFKNFNNWNPWARMDPKMKSEVIGVDGKEGTVYEWKGNDKVGSGEMKAYFVSDRELQYNMTFKEPWESNADGYWRVEDAGNGRTRAVWGFKSPASFPMNGIMMAMGMEKMLAKDFDNGLTNLKKYTETHTVVVSGKQ